MVTYSEIGESDLDEIIKLYEVYLNSGKYIRDSMRENFRKKDYIGVKACDTGKLAGFFTCQDGIGFTYPHPEMEAEIAQAARGKSIYTLDGLAVREEYRSRGIAEEMVLRLRDILCRKGVGLVLAEQWIYPDGRTIPAYHALRSMGKTVYEKKIPMFYRDLNKYQIRCPLCGDNCRCGAMIELLELDR